MQNGQDFLAAILEAARRNKANPTGLDSPIDALARMLGKSRSYVEKTLSTTSDTVNPFEALDAVLMFALMYAPQFGPLIADRYQTMTNHHFARQQSLFQPPTQEEWRTQLQEFFREEADVMAALAVNASSDDLLREREEANLQFKAILDMRRAQEKAGVSLNPGHSTNPFTSPGAITARKRR